MRTPGQHCEGSEAARSPDSLTLSWAPESLRKSSEGFVAFRDLRNVDVVVRQRVQSPQSSKNGLRTPCREGHGHEPFFERVISFSLKKKAPCWLVSC